MSEPAEKCSMTEREKVIREGFCFDSDRDCEAAKYLIGVIDVVRWDRKLLHERIAQQDREIVELRKDRTEVRRIVDLAGMGCAYPEDDGSDDCHNPDQCLFHALLKLTEGGPDV